MTAVLSATTRQSHAQNFVLSVGPLVQCFCTCVRSRYFLYFNAMILLPDYTHSLVNVTSSILNHFGAQAAHPPLPEVDEILKNGSYRNIVLLLFDGMGMDALTHFLGESSFLRSHLLCPISSVFPPTTTAATTSVETGLTPIEHGWLGWTLYFPSIDKNVNLFPNTLKDSIRQAAPYHVGKGEIPCTYIYDKINSAQSSEAAYSVSKFGTNKVKTKGALFEETYRLCTLPSAKYIYGYNEQPDRSMHISGTYSGTVKRHIKQIEYSVRRFCERLKNNPQTKDTLVLVSADHGHIPVENKELTSYPELETMLVRRPSLEPRAVNFFVKSEYKDVFPGAFARYFKTVRAAELFGTAKGGKSNANGFYAAGQLIDTKDAEFVLFSRDEVLAIGLFGGASPHPSTAQSLGDYLAVSCSAVTLVDSKLSHHFKSHHAGLTPQEMQVPLIAVR